MFNLFFKNSFKDKIWMILNNHLIFLSKYYQTWYNLHGRYTFINRSKNRKRLLIIVAGYKKYLWPPVFKRISQFVGKDIDVCIISPGLTNIKLKQIAKKNNWSYLSTHENKLGLAQNLAIKHHPQAELIYKLDEDIFITKNYFINLEKTLFKIKKEGIYTPGFIAPVINVNGFSYIYFLKKIGKDKEYLKKFGELKSACMGIKAHFSPEAAIFLWKHSLPLNKIACVFSNNSSYLLIPHRFSIGAILLERSLWEKMGYFKVASNGKLGFEEKNLCEFCCLNSFPGFIATNTFVGHFAFRPQNEKIKKYYANNKEQF